jgi:hypothetical protein
VVDPWWSAASRLARRGRHGRRGFGAVSVGAVRAVPVGRRPGRPKWQPSDILGCTQGCHQDPALDTPLFSPVLQHGGEAIGTLLPFHKPVKWKNKTNKKGKMASKSICQ